MIGAPFFGTRVRAYNLRKEREEYYLDLDIRKLGREDFNDFIRGLRILNEEIRRNRIGSRRYLEGLYLIRKSSKPAIVSRPKKGRESAVLDPVFNTVLHMLNYATAPKDIGLWWCIGGSKGKKFTDTLCTDPCLDHSFSSPSSYGAQGRRDIALNPWDLSSIGDLDTIISEYTWRRKTGTIGTTPFTFSKSRTVDRVTYSVTFIANSNTTIKTIILLLPTEGPQGYSPSSCNDYAPAPPGTCDSSYYNAVFLPLWGIETEINIVEGDPYKIVVEFYI